MENRGMNVFDAIIVGAGPVGLTFAARLAGAGLRIALVEQQPREALADPGFDGREIALTHDSMRTLRDCGVWQHIPAAEVSPLRAARVWNGALPYYMHIAKPGAEPEPLGSLIANHLIRRAAWERASREPGVTMFCDARVVSRELTQEGHAARVTLQDGRTLQAPLTVSADSRFSSTRRAAGISATSKDFGRTMLVCRMHHAKSHHDVAWEWFDHGQTLALLPLNGGFCSSVVVTVAGHEAQRLLKMSEADFDADMERRFQRRLGPMQLCSTRHAYPLVAVWAERFVAARHALIGDAAVGMHPVTAHGFNLGLRGAAALSRGILDATARSADVGGDDLLARYEREHRRFAWPLYTATNALVKVYTAEAPPMRFARDALLRAAGAFKPFRDAVAAMV
jgi:ubiquinone biosynthesis UbiH/UbiF/VisC/COQ6 family hydroxylase